MSAVHQQWLGTQADQAREKRIRELNAADSLRKQTNSIRENIEAVRAEGARVISGNKRVAAIQRQGTRPL